MKVFISYSYYSDNNKLDELLKKIKKGNPKLKDADFFDPATDLHAGSNYREEIKKVISSCDLFLLIWSQASSDSVWANYEIGMANAIEKRMLVVKEKGAPPLPGLTLEPQILHIE